MGYRKTEDGEYIPPTTSSSRNSVGDKVTWNNHSGTKSSHDVEVNQMNSKEKSTGDHCFYSPKSGVSGVAGGNRDK